MFVHLQITIHVFGIINVASECTKIKIQKLRLNKIYNHKFSQLIKHFNSPFLLNFPLKKTLAMGVHNEVISNSEIKGSTDYKKIF